MELPSELLDYIKIAKRDPAVEFECKVLAKEILTKNVADRISLRLQGTPLEEHYAVFSYQDGLRVNVKGVEAIHRVCTTGSFTGIPLDVQRKKRHPKTDLELTDYNLKFTLRLEDPVRKDFGGNPMDKTNYIRILHRRSWMSADGILRIDFSQVKSKTRDTRSFSDILKQTPAYELELELVDRSVSDEKILQSYKQVIRTLLCAFQQTNFLLTKTDVRRYTDEFSGRKVRFVNPVTLERRHIRPDRPHCVQKGYTVTNKADGERCMLVVMNDKRLVLVRPKGLSMQWTGLTATTDVHKGDTLDGEYLPHLNLFCIFDTYIYRGQDVRKHPLMTTDEDVEARPTMSRLGCGRSFVNDISTDFTVSPGQPGESLFRIESKLFLAGDGQAMETSIGRILDTKFEYETDGLIFTPRDSGVAPDVDCLGNTWLRVYKWKPANQNSVDFLIRFKPDTSYAKNGSPVFTGSLFVGRNRNSSIVYPCQTMTHEYTPKVLPPDLQRIAERSNRAPTPFQPTTPRDPNANVILIPLNEANVPVDISGLRVDDNTIVECSYDIDQGMWRIMRTRYDKTSEYRNGAPQFGNDSAVAESIWTSIHVPISDEMIRTCASNPPDDTVEDEQYYRTDLKRSDRANKDVYAFHNKIKGELFNTCVKPGHTLLELAMGAGGDLLKWKNSKASRVVGFDLAKKNLYSPEGACKRYLDVKAKEPTNPPPPALFIQGDMTTNLFELDDPYVRILNGTDQPTTKYLEQFANLTQFDAVSCQFAVHYACASEETFREFCKNLAHCKDSFFGTCLDGASVYKLLFGKTNHVFRVGDQIVGNFTKQYADSENWQEEFGQFIEVSIETFENPVREALVPFEKMTSMLSEVGFDLDTTHLFGDYYTTLRSQLTLQQQEYSFLHRSFVFRRRVKEEVQEGKLPVLEEAPVVPAAAPKKKIEKPKIVPLAEQPLLFTDASNFLSNDFVAPFTHDGISFPTVLHYYGWKKATDSGDTETADKITKTPATSIKPLKTLIEKIKDVPADWATRQDEIMKTGLRAKFVNPANEGLLKQLRDTGTRTLAYANPRDKYWSIGTSPDTDVAKTGKWKGANKLGILLMEVRTELKD